ncbi:MAG: hypothetical protein ACYC9L_09760 [Sulfuricaulis sp.]
MIKSRWVPVAAMVWWMLLYPHVASALTIKQLQSLTGTSLLGLRVGALLHDCGLPSAILDPTADSHSSHKIHWQHVNMKLSPKDWELVYRPHRDITVRTSGWTNPHPGGQLCRADLSELVVHAKGNVGILSVKKRTDNLGYRTSYRVPNNLYSAHQVIGITGHWKQGVPVSSIRKMYGNPDEIIDKDGGVKRYRYWVVVRNNKEMPISVQAVDFFVTDADKMCAKYSVQTDGFDFVQEKYDALRRKWERDYVLD